MCPRRKRKKKKRPQRASHGPGRCVHEERTAITRLTYGLDSRFPGSRPSTLAFGDVESPTVHAPLSTRHSGFSFIVLLHPESTPGVRHPQRDALSQLPRGNPHRRLASRGNTPPGEIWAPVELRPRSAPPCGNHRSRPPTHSPARPHRTPRMSRDPADPARAREAVVLATNQLRDTPSSAPLRPRHPRPSRIKVLSEEFSRGRVFFDRESGEGVVNCGRSSAPAGPCRLRSADEGHPRPSLSPSRSLSSAVPGPSSTRLSCGSGVIVSITACRRLTGPPAPTTCYLPHSRKSGSILRWASPPPGRVAAPAPTRRRRPRLPRPEPLAPPGATPPCGLYCGRPRPSTGPVREGRTLQHFSSTDGGIRNAIGD